MGLEYSEIVSKFGNFRYVVPNRHLTAIITFTTKEEFIAVYQRYYFAYCPTNRASHFALYVSYIA